MKYMATVLPVALVVGACSPPTAAQTALSTAARAVAEVDEVIAGVYLNAHAEALEESESRAEYDEMMQPMNRTEDALRYARLTLLSTQDALDAWEASANEQTFRASLPVLLDALRSVLDRLQEINAGVPSELVDAIGLIGDFLGES